MIRSSSPIVLAFLLAACGGQGAPSPSVMAVATPSTEPSVTAVPTPGASKAATSTPEVTPERCPTTTPIPLEALNLEECDRSGGVDVRAWIDAPVAIGFEPKWIEPKWLYFPDFDWALWSRPPLASQDCGKVEPCVSLYVFVDPDSGIEIGGPPRWVIVTGHTNDPAAATCHWASDPPREFSAEEDANAREHCAEIFVLTAIRDAP